MPRPRPQAEDEVVKSRWHRLIGPLPVKLRTLSRSCSTGRIYLCYKEVFSSETSVLPPGKFRTRLGVAVDLWATIIHFSEQVRTKVPLSTVSVEEIWPLVSFGKGPEEQGHSPANHGAWPTCDHVYW